MLTNPGGGGLLPRRSGMLIPQRRPPLALGAKLPRDRHILVINHDRSHGVVKNGWDPWIKSAGDTCERATLTQTHTRGPDPGSAAAGRRPLEKERLLPRVAGEPGSTFELDPGFGQPAGAEQKIPLAAGSGA